MPFARFNMIEVTAKTISTYYESGLTREIASGDELHATIFFYADGSRRPLEWKNTSFPTKCVRASMCLFSLENKQEEFVFVQSKSNSPYSCRPLLCGKGKRS